MAAAGVAVCDLLALQNLVKRDPEGYKEDFERQYRHFKALLSVFSLRPHAESKEFGDLAMFLAHLAPTFPSHLSSLASELVALLNSHLDVLHPPLRRQLAQALLLLRNRQMISLADLLPHLFRLFRCADKPMRKILMSHIVHDIRRANLKSHDDRVNRPLQNLFFGFVQDDNEAAAKRSLAILIDLYRRRVWTDARTVNVICQACMHPCTRVMEAALKFFLGTDADTIVDNSEDEDGDDDDNDMPMKNKDMAAVALDKELVYKAFHKGTPSSRKKKQAKLKRLKASLKRQQKSILSGDGAGKQGGGGGAPTFAALQLIHDPQGFAEKLFARLRTCNEKFEVKVLLMNVISRVIGSHNLLVLNFYPFIQRYLLPHQRDVTHLLAIAIQAFHDQVPPDAVEPLLKQLVNQFVHDRARPEVIAVGLNSVREICARMPLVMTEDLLRDLVLYKKARERPVVSAARSLISLFRQVAPKLLERKDRGPGANLKAKPLAYGQVAVSEGVPGIELLDLLKGMEGGEGEDEGEDEEMEDEEEDEDEEDEEGEGEGEDVGVAEGEEEGEEEGGVGEDEEEEGHEDGDKEERDDMIMMEDESASGSEGEIEGEIDGNDSDDEEAEEGGKMGDELDGAGTGVNAPKRKRLDEQEEQEGQGGLQGQGNSKKACVEGGQKGGTAEVQSLRQLKKKAAEAVKEGEEGKEGGEAEADGILSSEDFKKIRRLQAQQAAQGLLKRKGMKKASAIVSNAVVGAGNQHRLNGGKLDPASLQARIKTRQTKEERLATVMAGREDRSFMARSALKQKKVGGTSNRQKDKRKTVPLAVHRAKVKQRREKSSQGRRTKSKQFQGRKAWKN